jgi:hypothetical protein
MPKTHAKFVLLPITVCFIQFQLLLQCCGCHDEAKYKVSNTAECAPHSGFQSEHVVYIKFHKMLYLSVPARKTSKFIFHGR